jgi:hypothetical protein
VRASCSPRLTHRTYSTSSRTASHQGQTPGSLSSTTHLGTGSLATTSRRRYLALTAPTRSRTTPTLRTTGARTALPPPAPGRGAGTATDQSPALTAKTAPSPPLRSSSRTTASDPPTAKGGLEPGCPCRRQTRAQNPSAGGYRSSPEVGPPVLRNTGSATTAPVDARQPGDPCRSGARGLRTIEFNGLETSASDPRLRRQPGDAAHECSPAKHSSGPRRHPVAAGSRYLPAADVGMRRRPRLL